jgi:hypothetical protein
MEWETEKQVLTSDRPEPVSMSKSYVQKKFQELRSPNLEILSCPCVEIVQEDSQRDHIGWKGLQRIETAKAVIDQRLKGDQTCYQ